MTRAGPGGVFATGTPVRIACVGATRSGVSGYTLPAEQIVLRGHQHPQRLDHLRGDP